jgi:uncharacterized RDD family membrane protein YckC
MPSHDRIADYTRAVERLLACPPEQAAQRGRELAEHLHDAAQAGELDQALASLGDPQQAAEAFARERAAPPATFSQRAAAASLDNLPLIAVAIALALQGFFQGTGFTLAFPVHVYLSAGGACASLSFGGCEHYEPGLLYGIGVPAALLWSIAVLGLLEGATGSTPGKRLFGLRVVSERGLRIGVRPALVRRLSFLLGPVAWLDWAPFLSGHPRRLLDFAAATTVVSDARGVPK